MKKPSSPPAHKANFSAVNKASEPPGTFDAALRAIVRAPKAAVAASMAREQVDKRSRAQTKGHSN
jgi:hypothetical protein